MAVRKPLNNKKTGKAAEKKAPESRPADAWYGDFSISTIEKRTGLNRATVKKRLDLHKYEPIAEQEKLKIYRFDAKMEADLLETDTKLTEAKTRRELANAGLAEMKLAEAQGDLVPFGECVDAIGTIFGSLYTELVVRQPKRLAARLSKCNSASDVTAVLGADTDKIFQELRSNASKFLKEGEQVKAA